MSKNQGRQCDRFKKQRKIHKLWPVDHSSKARWEQWLTLRFSPQFTTSMVVQWIRICPLMQWTRVWSLVWEDSKCGETDKPLQHNYWARALETQRPNYWPCRLQLLTPMCPENQLLTLQAATPEARAPRDPTADPAGCNSWRPCAQRPNYWPCRLQLLRPARREPVLCDEKPSQWEGHTQSAPLSTTGEKSPCVARRPGTINKHGIFLKKDSI